MYQRSFKVLIKIFKPSKILSVHEAIHLTKIVCEIFGHNFDRCGESSNVQDPIKYILTLAAGLFTIICMGGAKLFAIREFIVAGVGGDGGHPRT